MNLQDVYCSSLLIQFKLTIRQKNKNRKSDMGTMTHFIRFSSKKKTKLQFIQFTGKNFLRQPNTKPNQMTKKTFKGTHIIQNLFQKKKHCILFPLTMAMHCWQCVKCNMIFCKRMTPSASLFFSLHNLLPHLTWWSWPMITTLIHLFTIPTNNKKNF